MKTALVTGANRGIGQGFVEVLSQRGYIVYATGRHKNHNPSAENVRYVSMDVTDDDSIQAVIEQIKTEHGSLNLLINNAGLNKDTATNGQIEKVTKLESLDRRVMQNMFDTNATSPLMVAKSALPLMTTSNCFIVNISSERASFADETNSSANYGYRATKVALNMLTKALLFDLPSNVSTFAVHPGHVKTDMNPRGVLSPQTAAASIMGIIDNWQPSLNGQFLDNDGSLYPR